MKREAVVDFFVVEPHHIKVHARLENWRRWARSGGGYGISPMFLLYRAPDQEEREDVTKTSIPIDSIDGMKIQKAVTGLPQKHRASMNWNYLRPCDPKKAARTLAVTLDGLLVLVRDSRQMLVNRGY